MVIESLLHITEGKYIFNFKHSAGLPTFPPIFEGDITIWICSEGVVIRGRKLAGHVGKSLFKVCGSSVNSPLAKTRIMLCKWSDVEIYNSWNRRSSDVKILFYPHTLCSYMKSIHIVDGHIRRARRFRDEIFRIGGNGVPKQICDNLASRGYFYNDGIDVFSLNKKKGVDSYFFMKIMSLSEFKKIENGLECYK